MARPRKMAKALSLLLVMAAFVIAANAKDCFPKCKKENSDDREMFAVCFHHCAVYADDMLKPCLMQKRGIQVRETRSSDCMAKCGNSPDDEFFAVCFHHCATKNDELLKPCLV